MLNYTYSSAMSGGTLNLHSSNVSSSATSQYTAAMVHAMPRPRKTFTEFDPVTFVIAASALSSLIAAARDANVSGSDVLKSQ